MNSSPTILITGGAKRLGAALALRCANAGWNVAVHRHRSQNEAETLVRALEKAGVCGSAFSCDLGNAESVKTLIPRIVEKMGPLTALVNNASLFLRDSKENPEHHAAHRQVNYFAPLQLMEDFAVQLPAGEKGAVLNILDGCFGWSMGPKFHSYTESRLALWREIPVLALGYAPRIRVNGLAPGHTLAGERDKAGTAEKLRAQIPLQRLSAPPEFCDAALFLLSAPSLTGHVLELNGGSGLISPPLADRGIATDK